MSGANPGAIRSAQVRRADADEGGANVLGPYRGAIAAGWNYPFAHRSCAEWR